MPLSVDWLRCRRGEGPVEAKRLGCNKGPDSLPPGVWWRAEFVNWVFVIVLVGR